MLAAAWALLLAFAPAARNTVWGVNGLRSVTPLAVALVVLAAALAVFAPRVQRHAARLAALAGVALALLLAGALRHRFHLLGDSATRWGGIADYAQKVEPTPLADWARIFHAQPLDLLAGLLAPAWVLHLGGTRELGVGLSCVLLACAFFAGAWRLAKALAAGDADAFPFWLALLAWGGLEAFAGYAESAGIALAAGAWWWVAMFAPLRRGRDAVRLAAAWLLVFASHRIGLVLLAPQLVRLLGPAQPDDAPAVRRSALVATVLVAVAALGAQAALAGGRLGSDFGEMLRWPDADALAMLPTDLANVALLMAPLAILALLLGGAAALRGAIRDPRAPALAVTALLLAPTVLQLPYAESGLGQPRDWDLGVLLGLALTLAGALVLAHAAPVRRRLALTIALPLLVLGAGGWVAVNADNAASATRAIALITGTPHLGARGAAGVELMLGDRAVELDHMAEGARMLEASWQHVPSPARGLHAARAWLYAGDAAGARRMLEAVRGRGGLSPRRVMEADTLESYVRLIEAARANPR